LTLPGSHELVIGVAQHEDGAPEGLLSGWAAARGIALRVVRPDGGEALPEDVDALVVLGSECYAIRGEHAWIDTELDQLAALAPRLPVLGICYGAQALSVALGGRRRRAQVPEIGWVGVASQCGGVCAGPWFAWHDDVIEPPPGATVTAHNAYGPQAFRHGRHVGVQFHPEVTPGIVAGWAEEGAADLRRAGVDPRALELETLERAPAAAVGAQRLFDSFALGAGLLACDGAALAAR
jgi:GMP synthase-like glutamine amidotransferase